MVLPLVPAVLIAIGSVTGAGGVVLGGNGAADIKRARERVKRAAAAYESDLEQTERWVASTNDRLVALGGLQREALQDVALRMGDFLRRNSQKVKESERLLVDGIDVTVGAVPGSDALDVDALAWVSGVIGSAATGVGMSAGVTGAVGTYGVASTGAAISGLSGAAAESATLAALGGGSLATGGGGVALGATALNFVSVGPALLVGGFVLHGRGDKAKTDARKYEAKVGVARAGLSETRTRVGGVDQRALEIMSLLTALRDRAVESLDVLESEPFLPDRHAGRFQESLNLVMAVRDVAATPVVDGAGVLNERTAGFEVKYRPMTEETEDD